MDGVILSKSAENCAESLGLFNNKNEIMTLDGTKLYHQECNLLTLNILLQASPVKIPK